MNHVFVVLENGEDDCAGLVSVHSSFDGAKSSCEDYMKRVTTIWRPIRETRPGHAMWDGGDYLLWIVREKLLP